MSSNLKILVVEDNLVTARGLEIKLQKIGYPNIHLARTSRECMDVLDKELVDLVLMDIELKGSDMDGIDTAKAIFETFDIPVIFLTAFTDPETLARAGEVEHLNYLVKPVNERQLFVAIQQALSQRHPLVELNTMLSPQHRHEHGAIFIKGKEKFYERVEIHDIVCIEADNSGVFVHTLQGRYFTYNALQSIMEVLRGHPFLRVHKSLAVNKDHVIAKSESELVLRNGTTHAVGKAFREAVEGQFKVLRPKA